MMLYFAFIRRPNKWTTTLTATFTSSNQFFFLINHKHQKFIRFVTYVRFKTNCQIVHIKNTKQRYNVLTDWHVLPQIISIINRGQKIIDQFGFFKRNGIFIDCCKIMCSEPQLWYSNRTYSSLSFFDQNHFVV